jgi:hypothetical protein
VILISSSNYVLLELKIKSCKKHFIYALLLILTAESPTQGLLNKIFKYFNSLGPTLPQVLLIGLLFMQLKVHFRSLDTDFR